jgi:hypothetical protein
LWRRHDGLDTVKVFLTHPFARSETTGDFALVKVPSSTLEGAELDPNAIVTEDLHNGSKVELRHDF